MALAQLPQKPKTYFGYDQKGKAHKYDGKEGFRCKKYFQQPIEVLEFLDKCDKAGGKRIYPDVCSERVWCSLNVNKK